MRVKGVAVKTPASPKKGFRLTKEEVDLISHFADLNWTNKQIADFVKRDEDTISKYRRKAKAETESQGVLKEALKDAQRDHWRTLTTAALGLRGRFFVTSPHYAEDLRKRRQPGNTDRREQLLISALREYHAPDHRLWRLIESWTESSAILLGGCEEAWQSVDLVPHSLGIGKEVIKPIFHEKVVGAWFRGAIALQEEQLHVEELTGPQDQVALVIGGAYVATGARGAVEKVRETACRLLREMGDSDWNKQVSDAYQKLRDLNVSIGEAVEEIGLMEGFPGECPYCPARTLNHPIRKVRRQTS